MPWMGLERESKMRDWATDRSSVFFSVILVDVKFDYFNILRNNDFCIVILLIQKSFVTLHTEKNRPGDKLCLKNESNDLIKDNGCMAKYGNRKLVYVFSDMVYFSVTDCQRSYVWRNDKQLRSCV